MAEAELPETVLAEWEAGLGEVLAYIQVSDLSWFSTKRVVPKTTPGTGNRLRCGVVSIKVRLLFLWPL